MGGVYGCRESNKGERGRGLCSVWSSLFYKKKPEHSGLIYSFTHVTYSTVPPGCGCSLILILMEKQEMQEKVRTKPIKAVSDNIMSPGQQGSNPRRQSEEIQQRKESEIRKGPETHANKRKAGKIACWVTPTK